MANVDVSVSSKLPPEQAWKLASDLHRFDEWLTIFGGWRSPVPDVIEQGTAVSSCIKVKGFRNTIHWEVTEYDEPQGTTFHLLAELKGGVLSGPVGGLVARVIKSDVERSVQNLVALGR
jgi:hypothetical protein